MKKGPFGPFFIAKNAVLRILLYLHSSLFDLTEDAFCF